MRVEDEGFGRLFLLLELLLAEGDVLGFFVALAGRGFFLREGGGGLRGVDVQVLLRGVGGWGDTPEFEEAEALV